MKCRTILLIGSFLCVFSISFANDFFWIDPAGGGLGDPVKWDPPATPGVDDHVFFSLPYSFLVWLQNNYTHDRLIVDGSDLTLDLNGNTYLLDGRVDNNCAVIIGDEGFGAVTILEGNVLSRDLFLGRNQTDSTGRLSLSGAGTSWSGYIDPDWHGFFYGNAGDAEVSVTDNASLSHGHGQSAINPDSSALFNVKGPDSEWFVAGYFGMSMWGDTTLNLGDGATARYGYLEMAVFPGSSAVINAAGPYRQTEVLVENWWWDPVSLFIGREGEGIINLSGSTLTNFGNTVIAEYPNGRGELNINDGAWADLQGSVAVGGSLDQPGGRGLIRITDNPFNGEPADLSCARQEGQYLVIWPEGTIQMDAGTIWMDWDADSANPLDLRGGKLEGWGSIYAQVNNISGVVAPGTTGNYWRALELKYDYTQGPEATLKIGLRGPAQYWDYGVLAAIQPDHGQVSLDGFLDVDLWGNYIPNYNDAFVIVQGQSVSGRFINAPSRLVFEGGSFDVLYEVNQVVLTHFQPEPRCRAFPAADLNKDCMVNLEDLSILAADWITCNLVPEDFCL